MICYWEEAIYIPLRDVIPHIKHGKYRMY